MSVWEPLAGSRAAAGLASQIASSAVPHAWLLIGPAGSGKRAAAQAMAAALNCLAEPGVGCGHCSSCMRILRARHPDVHHIVPEGPLIPVDVIRETVIPEAARSPFEGIRKVFIIEEAERMNPNAQNALLKTLEEPQPDTVFVLISDQEDELLETIRSRCRVYRLDPVPEQRIVELLVAEGTSDARALVSARVSEGHLERARSLALDDDAAARRALWVALPSRLDSAEAALDAAQEVLEEVKIALGELARTQRQQVSGLAEAMGEGRGTAGARNALATRHKRELRRLEEVLLGEAFQSLGSFYRDVLVVRRGGAETITNLDLAGELARWAKAPVSDAALIAAVERCIAAGSVLERNANQTLLVESVLLELGRLVAPVATVV